MKIITEDDEDYCDIEYQLKLDCKEKEKIERTEFLNCQKNQRMFWFFHNDEISE